MLHIRIARGPQCLHQVFRLRHQVLAEEQAFYPTHASGLLTDRFDAFPSSRSFIAYFDGEPVATMRVTLPSAVGTPADEFFQWGSQWASVGMFCLLPQYRRQNYITRQMIRLAILWGHAQQVAWVCAPLNPALVSSMKRLGFEQVAPMFYMASEGLQVVPMALEVARASFGNMEALPQFLARETYERVVYRPGEMIMKQGELVQHHLAILHGHATVQGFDGGVALLPGTDLWTYQRGARAKNTIVAETDVIAMVLAETTPKKGICLSERELELAAVACC